MLAPVAVVSVEIGQTIPDIPHGYRAAQVIVRDGGIPVGQRRVPLGDNGINPEDLAGLWHDGPGRPALRVPDDAPFISIVVPSAMQRPAELVRCMSKLAALDYPQFEVILVDNSPHGTPVEIPGVRIVREPVRGASAARNRGIAEAKGEIVAFTDDDIDVDPHWLTAIAHRFAVDPATDCVTGWVFPATLETEAQVWFENSGSTIGTTFAVMSYQREGSDRYRVTGHVPIYRGIFGGSGNLAIKASVLAARGGFNRALGAGTIARGGEDIEFLTRLLYHGHRVTMDPAMAVHHHHRADYAGLRKQMFGYGTGYTAALTALIAADPRHLIGLARMAMSILRGSRERREPTSQTRPEAGNATGTGALAREQVVREAVAYPSGLRWVERWGLLAGPFTYLRSRLAYKRSAS